MHGASFPFLPGLTSFGPPSLAVLPVAPPEGLHLLGPLPGRRLGRRGLRVCRLLGPGPVDRLFGARAAVGADGRGQRAHEERPRPARRCELVQRKAGGVVREPAVRER